MEKRVVLAIVVITAITAGWIWWRAPKAPAGGKAASGTASAVVGTSPAIGTRMPVGPGTGPVPVPPLAPNPDGGPKPAPVDEAPVQSITIEEPRRTVELSSRGGGTIRNLEIWGCLYHDAKDKSVQGDPGLVTVAPTGRPGALAVGVLGDPQLAGIDIASWAMEREGAGVAARIERGGLKIEKWIVPADASQGFHHYDVTVRITNAGGAKGERVLVLRGPWTPHSTAHIPEDGVLLGAIDEDGQYLPPHEAFQAVAEKPSDERRSPKGWRYIGARSDFYLGAIASASPLPEGTAVTLDAVQLMTFGGKPVTPWPSASAAMLIPFRVPDAAAPAEFRFRFYAGPNSRAFLAKPEYENLRDAFPNRSFLGLTFGPIGRALAWLLDRIAALGVGYGLAVCALTVLVRMLLFPLSRKSQVSMKVHGIKMAKAKPRLDAVREKYKDNAKKQQEETMKVMREEKLSILPAGCLLAFLQMPIWISLYATLQTHFEMRHASFLWIHDLTMPDHLVEIPWAAGVPLLRGWFNLLPLLMVITWFGSSLMQPLPDDPDQRSQAKMMRFLPLLFGFFMYETAAGLTLYMTLSALWSIGESWLIKKVWIAPLDAEAKPFLDAIRAEAAKKPSPKR